MAVTDRNLPQNSIYWLAEKYSDITKYSAAEYEAMQTRLKDVGYPDISPNQLIWAVTHVNGEKFARSGPTSGLKKWMRDHQDFLKNRRLSEAFNAYFRNRERERGDGNWKWYQGDNLKGIVTAAAIVTAVVAAPAILTAAPVAAPAAAAPSAGSGFLSSIEAGLNTAYTTVSSVVSSTAAKVTSGLSSIEKAVESSGAKEAVDLVKKGEAAITTVKALTSKGAETKSAQAAQVEEGPPAINGSSWLPALAGVVLFAIIMIIGGKR